MSTGLILKIVMQNFAAIRSAVREKMTFEVAICGNFPDIPEVKLSLPFWVMEGRMCETVRLAELWFLYFCERKTRGETQCWIKLAAPCTLTNHNEIGWYRFHRYLCFHFVFFVRVFRAQEPKAPVTFCDHALSGVRPSVVRPSSVKLFTFSTSSPEHLDGFWWNLVWMKYSRSLTSVVVFRPDPSRGGSRAGQK